MPLSICIAGRPNTGKSTLFNALTRTSKAMTDDMPGVTRDSIYGFVELGDGFLTLIDTGGIVAEENLPGALTAKVNQLVYSVIEESDAVIFLADRKTGYVAGDQEILANIRRMGKKLYFCVNKVDDDVHEPQAAEFFESGEQEVMMISASHRRGLDYLIERIETDFAQRLAPEPRDSATLSIAIIGRPNVGKSTLVNRLTGTDKQLTHDLSGTTREAVDNYFRFHGRAAKIIDTAGIRKKSAVKEKLEKLSVLSSIRSVSEADVTILMMDAEGYATDQDLKLASYVKRQGRPLFLVINKWDSLEKDSRTLEKTRKEILEKMAFVDYSPVFFISAKTGQRVHEMIGAIFTFFDKLNRLIPQTRIIKLIKQATEEHSIPMVRGRRNLVSYGLQTKACPATFVFKAKYPDEIPDSYTRYIEGRLRKAFDLSGIPVRIFWDAK